MTQNRDEFINRSKPGIVKKKIRNKEVRFPQDNGGGGTWMAISDHNQMVCLLNGAFNKHKHRPPYRRSRGLVVLDYFEAESSEAFFSSYNLEGIEPFTMIIYDNGQLYEWRWDEKQRYLSIKDPKGKYLWASCTLYPPEHQAKRQRWFADWNDKIQITNQKEILDFHKHAGDGDPSYDLVMNRMDIVKTTSITSFKNEGTSTTLKHIDLINKEEQNEVLQTRLIH